MRNILFQFAWSDSAQAAPDEEATEPQKKEYHVHEFKPTDAAGLPLRTTVAKDSRVYFIRLSKEVLGILDIDLRANQNTFLKRILGIRQAVDPKA